MKQNNDRDIPRYGNWFNETSQGNRGEKDSYKIETSIYTINGLIQIKLACNNAAALARLLWVIHYIFGYTAACRYIDR